MLCTLTHNNIRGGANSNQLIYDSNVLSPLQMDPDIASKISRKSSFTDQGGSSLHLVIIQREIEKKYGLHLSFKDIVSASTLSDFVNLVKNKESSPDSVESEVDRKSALRKQIIQDATLDLGILDLHNQTRDLEAIEFFIGGDAIHQQNIMLSGATGK